jgi:antitoxin VapB
MALDIKDEDTEALVARIAAIPREPKPDRKKMTLEEIEDWLETEVWPRIPEDERGRRLTKAEREEILGYGPEGF